MQSFVMLIFILFIGGCTSTKLTVPEYIPIYVETKPSKLLQIPYPILLLHGLGQKASVWDKHAIKFYEQDLGLKHAGILKPSKKGIFLDQKSTTTLDFFTVQFSKPTDSVEGWTKELEQCIAFVREKTGAEKVILIGYSMGGLTGRHYLTKHVNNHHVQRLITIGSPHQGSAFAKVYNWKTAVNSSLQDGKESFLKPIVEQASELIRKAENDVPFDSPAVRDLRRPQDGGWFIEKSGNREHPLDVEYISVIGDVDIMKEISVLNKSGAKELFRRIMGLLGMGIESLFEGGDGVVSASSQTINELPWFRSQPGRQRISQTIKLSSVHEEHLKNSSEIQKLSLEDQPEFKGAEFFRNADSDALLLILEYTDYLPKDGCSVNIEFKQSGKSTMEKISPKDIALVSTSSGLVKRCAIEIPKTIDITSAFETSILIKNTFGRQCTAMKSWRGF
ncbi:MAG: alpha/beta fold hydrolase [Candidatus Kapaibacteriota bacterium]